MDGYEFVRPFAGDQLRHLRLFLAVRAVSDALWITDHSRELANCRDGLQRWADILAARARGLAVL